MKSKLPMTLLAQLDDVAVFQTAALANGNKCAADTNSQQMHELGQASYGALNLGLHVNDDAAKVLDNRMRLLTAINEKLNSLPSTSAQNAPIKRLHWVNQVHGNDIHHIDATALSMQPLAADAILSQQQGVGLAIMTADCVPIVLYQPASGKIAAIHAGWQGLACGVIQATAERFTDSGQIMAWIGVCISQQNYEVGSQVRDKLLAGCVDSQLLTSANIERFDARYVMDSANQTGDDSHTDTSKNSDVNPQCLHKTVDKLANYAKVNADNIKLNLPRLAADQLTAAGMTLCNESAIGCSYGDDRYYSYRRQTHLQQPATGRMALVIVRRASTQSDTESDTELV
ncbi:laccase domain-containing protein [Psychrobacter okhotskensis]|uniref:polyphenol oxidase family protein n=1 Tax=Psychrobacter okhotskensis TaxID=212403 RepID=UPI0015678474|nr:polyphenol oxidase family protein [Psychrobacter okhotskensis]NRD71371.1 laccase domain-containing protein [Psychrobacter okhotskensis]